MFTTFFVLLQLSILAYALVAGVFLAFSDFIMRSLALSGGEGGVEAMQVINREVFRWVFMALFLGIAAVSVLIAGYAWVTLYGFAGALIGVAALVYLVGCFGVTVAFNVPMNEALPGRSRAPRPRGTTGCRLTCRVGPSGTRSARTPPRSRPHYSSSSCCG